MTLNATDLAQLITTGIAIVAAVIAVVSIRDQRGIARRRAALDFFLKTQMDDTGIKLYNDFKRIAPGIAAAVSMESFVTTADHERVRAFLNICELIAVGINERVFSERVSYAYWGDVLPWSYQAAEPLIKYVRQRPGDGTAATYRDLEKVATAWAGRNARRRQR
jgi:hypothetical protein